MTQEPPFPPDGFDDLSINERIDYVQALWDHIASEADALPIPEWQVAILNERLAEHERNPGAGSPVDEVFDRLSRNLSDRGAENGSLPRPSAKVRAIRAIGALPEDASPQDIIERLHRLSMT